MFLYSNFYKIEFIFKIIIINNNMNSVKFGNKKALQINNEVTKTDILNRLKNKWNIEIEYKRYHFLDNHRAKELKQKEHSFVLNTYGSKYLIYLTKQCGKNYIVFICRKTQNLYMVKSRFDEALFNETILEGELLKVDGYWYFYLSDVIVYKNDKIITESFDKRYDVLEKIMSTEYMIDPYLDCFSLLLKDRFTYSELVYCKDEYIPRLPFKVNGMLFKSHSLSAYDILYIFPECRNKSVKSEVKVVSPKIVNNVVHEKIESIGNIGNIDNIDNIYTIQKTDYPDVYEIYDYIHKNMVKVGYASVPNLKVSNLIREWFADEEINKIKAKCIKDTTNHKWIPNELVATIK